MLASKPHDGPGNSTSPHFPKPEPGLRDRYFVDPVPALFCHDRPAGDRLAGGERLADAGKAKDQHFVDPVPSLLVAAARAASAAAAVLVLALTVGVAAVLMLFPAAGLAQSERTQPVEPGRSRTASGARDDLVRAQGGGIVGDDLGRPQTQASIRDDLGRPFPLPAAAPARIVSMAPNITEILFALGLGDRIVGVTRFCDYPPGAEAVPKVGGLVDPNVEIILSLKPGLVLAFRGNPLRVIDRLGELHVPVFVFDIGGGLDDMCGLVTRIGSVTRREREAQALAAALRSRLDALEARLAGVAARPRVFVILHSQGLWTSGGEGYISDLVARAGAVNIAAGIGRKWVLYSRERIVRDDPDAVFVLARSRREFEAAREWMAGEARLGGVKAVRTGRVFLLDQDAASRFGPRLVDVLETMARDLHPERFGEGR